MFPLSRLCSVIAAINNSRDEEIAILKNQCTIDTSFPVGSNMDVANSAPKWMWPTREAHDNAVTCLANRISSDLEVRVVIIVGNEVCLAGDNGPNNAIFLYLT